MSTVRPAQSLHNLGRMPSSSESNLVTRCKNCPYSIYRNQPHIWQFGQTPGLVHIDCNNPDGSTR